MVNNAILWKNSSYGHFYGLGVIIGGIQVQGEIWYVEYDNDTASSSDARSSRVRWDDIYILKCVDNDKVFTFYIGSTVTVWYGKRLDAT